jgi:C4-dicarboxylate-specific signal transduction histidine kinase
MSDDLLEGQPLGPRPSRLIIVDDEPSILSLLLSIFKDSPFEVIGCDDGRRALEAMRDGGVDVLLTDKNLPDIGGLELLRHAHELQADSEVILITGYASLDTALQAIDLGAYDYIVKPPKNIFDVRRKVIQAMERIAVVRENQRLLEHLRQKNGELADAVVEMKGLQREVVQSEKLAGIGTLAAGVAHEISSPLFGIMGLAEAIAEEEDLALAQGYAREIVEYSRNIREIVQELSGYARTPVQEALRPINLVTTIEDAVKLVSRSQQVDARYLRVRYEGEMKAFVRAHATELQQVFVNLLKNGLEAVVERHGEVVEGSLELVLCAAGGGLEVTVTDRGCGIPSDQIRQVFDPFFTTKPPGKGTGLGLNIVYRIISKYEGQVSVDSEPGEGTVFRVWLPAGRDE